MSRRRYAQHAKAALPAQSEGRDEGGSLGSHLDVLVLDEHRSMPKRGPRFERPDDDPAAAVADGHARSLFVQRDAARL